MITAIILAAGTSTRLGTPKQLLKFQDRPMIRWITQNVLKSDVDEVIVVLGHQVEKISKVLEDLPIKAIYNPDFHQGQSTSVKLGVNSCSKGSSFLFILGDQPFVKVDTINLLIKEFQQHGGIIVPYYQGRRGNPVIIDEKFTSEFSTLSGDIGARKIILQHPESIVGVNITDEGIIFDIDTWEDYRHIRG